MEREEIIFKMIKTKDLGFAVFFALGEKKFHTAPEP